MLGTATFENAGIVAWFAIQTNAAYAYMVRAPPLTQSERTACVRSTSLSRGRPVCRSLGRRGSGLVSLEAASMPAVHVSRRSFPGANAVPGRIPDGNRDGVGQMSASRYQVPKSGVFRGAGTW